MAFPCSMFCQCRNIMHPDSFMIKYLWKKWIVYSKLHFIKYEQLILTRIAVLFVIDVQDPAIFLRRLPLLGFLLIYVPACWFHQNLAIHPLLYSFLELGDVHLLSQTFVQRVVESSRPVHKPCPLEACS